jgi:hypothetical protein
MSSAEFWRLIDLLGIPDADALILIGYAGKLSSSEKRPRFRLTTRQPASRSRSGWHRVGISRRARKRGLLRHFKGISFVWVL